ncbi:hypothetical protein [Anaerotruncus massiliensis (ex Togo et al. 2019)]|mgnify:FL=1|uniref:hypothetical protein n=1 Tax=Anaerotruncus TaxID=244127 RepID=UPI0020801DAE|nr:hypothetical protein [Anaerotruncus massiliensis (ex Togo et al. 2019)]GKH45732.1 hypothetical protein CE91St45_02940 [Oscillospiraceae bacterium]
MNYAMLKDGIVQNVIVLSPHNASDFPAAVPAGDKPVAVGDEYRDGRFWRDGAVVLSETEQLQAYYTEVMAALPPGTEDVENA